MKQIRFVISNDTFGRNYLAIKASQATFNDPIGIFWTNFETWKQVQKEIEESPRSDSGIITAFRTKEEAEAICREFKIKDYTIREILMEV